MPWCSFRNSFCALRLMVVIMGTCMKVLAGDLANDINVTWQVAWEHALLRPNIVRPKICACRIVMLPLIGTPG